MTRDTAITVLLIVAGVILAFLLFGAGAFWGGKARPKPVGMLIPNQKARRG